FDETGTNRVGDQYENYRHGAGCLQQRPDCRGAAGQDDVGCERGQFGSAFTNEIWITGTPTIIEAEITAVRPAQALQGLQECLTAGPTIRVVLALNHQHTNVPHTALLRARRNRPSCRSTTKNCDKLAPLHSITSSAMLIMPEGTFAVLMLITNSNFVGCNIGDL